MATQSNPEENMKAVLNQVDALIAVVEEHKKQLDHVMPLMWQKFTYENHEFTSCTMCGHSDAAMLYELQKLRTKVTDMELNGSNTKAKGNSKPPKVGHP